MQLPISINPGRRSSLQRQIFEQVVTLIDAGILRAGDPLPGSRTLGEQLGVARNTVTLAYAALAREGFVETRDRHRARVAERLPREFLASRRRFAQLPRSGPERRPEPLRFGPWRGPLLYDPASDRLRFDFRLGRPDRTLFPHRQWHKLANEHLHRAAVSLTDYGDPLGLRELRAAIAETVRVARGIHCCAEQVCVVAGVQEGLNLVARLLLQPGMTVLSENPSYASAVGVWKFYGANLVAAPVGAEGLDAGALPAAGARLAYVTPSHQFPLGPTMSLTNRLGLLEWARRNGAFIVEDDYDGDFRYQGSPLQALAALDRSERVIYLGTFSKSLGAGLRLGYAILPPSLVPDARAVKDLYDHGHAWLDQAVLADFIRSGAYEAHLRRIRRVYLERRDSLLQALRQSFGAVQVWGLEGGMHLSWQMPPDWPDAAELRRRLLDRGVGLYTLTAGPASLLQPFAGWDRYALLGFSCLKPTEIGEAVAHIAAAVAED